jgi:chromosome segregation ATPase
MLNAVSSAKQSLGRDIAEAESLARRAERNVNAVQAGLAQNEARVNELTGNINRISQDVSSQRKHLYAMDNELVRLNSEQEADRKVIQRNEQKIQNLNQDLQAVAQVTEANQQSIEQVQQHTAALQREADLARQRLTANERHVQKLQNGVQRINQYLQQERNRQESERRAKERDVVAQEQLAARLCAQIDPARARFFAAQNELALALTTVDQARLNQKKGNLAEALVQYQQAQATLLKIATDIDERERQFENKRAQCQAALDQLNAEMNLLNTTDMQQWYPGEYAQLNKRFEALRDLFAQKRYETAGDPGEVRQALESLNLQAMQIYQDARQLEDALLKILAQHQERQARARDILRTLRRVWDIDFEWSRSFVNEQDPKSTLKIQTQRPGAPNVTVYLDLDRTMQFSWTGYEGAKCLEDIQQFEQIMRAENKIEIQLVSAVDHPGQPNPPFGGNSGNGGIVIPQPEPAKPKTPTVVRH